RIVIDCANGAAYKVAPEVLWELGADIVTLGVTPDGTNINQDCGSTAPQAMCAKVREVRADFGIALDGDADRVVMADEHGRIIDGDQVLALIAKSWSKNDKLKGGGVVGTVMSNAGLDRYLKTLGLSLARSTVGDRYVLEEMAKGGVNVGGEQSGHIILSDFSTTGDGLIAALKVLAVLAQKGMPAAQAFGVYAQTVITAVTVQDTHKVHSVNPVSADIVVAQIAVALNDIGADAIKIGMLGNGEIASAVADALEDSQIPLVLDTVLLSSSGTVLLDEAGVAVLKTRLMRRAA